MDHPEVKEAVDALGTAFEEFKSANDLRLKEMENGRGEDPVLTEKLDRINTEIEEKQDEIDSLKKSIDKERTEREDLEVRMKRSGKSEYEAKEERKLDKEFKSFKAMAEVLRPGHAQALDLEGYKAYKETCSKWLRYGPDHLSAEEVKTLAVGSDPDGGYWVTPDMTGRTVDLIEETSPMRQVAAVQTINTDALEGIRDIDEATSGGWVSETATRSTTDTPQIGQWRIPTHEQFAQPQATQKLLDDANVNVENWLSGKVADILTRTENTAFVNGDGDGKPRGFLQRAATTEDVAPTASSFDALEFTKTGANGAFAASDPGDVLITSVFSLKDAYRAGATWMMKRATLAAVRKLKDGDGNYLWQPDFGQTARGQLLGFGITGAEDMPTIATNSLSIAFGNFQLGYQIVDRQGMRILRDPFTSKPFVKFYTTKRTGGDVTNFEAIKLIKFAA